MAIARKPATDVIARIESGRFSQVVPPYGGSVEQLPASFWRRFAEALNEPASDATLQPEEWLLQEAAHSYAYHVGAEIIRSNGWLPFIPPLDSERANDQDVLHAVFAALGGFGLDECDIVDLVPFERLKIRIYSYEATLENGDQARPDGFVVRGVLAAVMDLAYGSPQDASGATNWRMFDCRQTRFLEHGDSCDEFVASRRSPL